MNVVKKASSDAWSGADGEKQKQVTVQQGGSGSEAEDKWAQGWVEDQINNQHLRRIQAMFQEADKDGGGALDMDEFREAMKKIMGDVEDEDLDIIFMKVDTNCDGTVDWDEYVNYMLLEYREKDTLQKQNVPVYFPKPLKTVPVAQCEPIVRLQFYPFLLPMLEKKGMGGWRGTVRKTRVQPGRYLSITRNATLNYWSETFELTRSITLDSLRRTWVTDMVCLSNLNFLAIASTRRDIEFYDISASKCDHVFSLVVLDGYVSVMDYWSDGSRGVFSIGDTDGCLTVFISFDVIHNGLFNIGAFKPVSGLNCRIPVSLLLKNTSQLYLCFKVALYNDWCQQVRFLPELNAVATCCTSVMLTTIPCSHKAKVHNSVFYLKKGILCFDYSSKFNILVTGGFDHTVQTWNPYITNTATSLMKGHSSAVVYVAVNDQDSKIISFSKDQNVRVWDLQECVCLQSIPSQSINMGRSPISSMYYNKDTNTLILATFIIGVLYGAVDGTDALNKLKTSHEHSVCAALYNSNFKQVVSGCHNGVVSVWDILTGTKVMQFQTSPKKPVEITAMTFDGPKRRLITGSKDGSLRLWNFNNGALLLTLPLLDNNEVTSILYINQRIYVSGWGKRVIWYLDIREDDEMEYRVWNQYHAEDIYSMHAHANKMLVTASYSGDIIIWNIDSGRAFCRFNATESPQPLLPNRVLNPALDTLEGPQPPSTFESDLQGGLAKAKEDTWTTCSRASSSSSSSSTSHVQLEAPCLKGKSLNASTPLRQKPRPPQGSSSSPHPNPLSPEQLEKPKHAVERALFLGTRERGPDTAILLTCAADGYVYAWSIHHQGGLLGKFRAAYNEGDVITSMSTDSQDQMLLTGDSNGYVTLWDIEGYCCCQRREHSVRLTRLIPKYCQIEGKRKMAVECGSEVRDGWGVSLAPPPLRSTWRCHLKPITSLEYVERFRLIVTSSLDCNVRVWTIAGRYVGTFGQALWHVGDPGAFREELPVDLRRVASYQTLKVLNKGMKPHWNYVMWILRTLTKMQQQNTATSKMEGVVLVNPRITVYTTEQIDATWRRREERGKHSSLLGSAYKPKVRHRLPSCPPDLQTSFSSREQLRVYSLMQCSALLPSSPPALPELLRKQQLKVQEGADSQGRPKPSGRRRPHVRFTTSAKGGTVPRTAEARSREQHLQGAPWGRNA